MITINPALEELHNHFKLILRNRRIDKVQDQEIISLFTGFFEQISDFDIKKLEKIWRQCGFRISQPLIDLVKRWNALATESQRLDLEIFLATYKDRLHERAVFMKSSVIGTTHLENIFDEQWFNEVNQLIDRYDGNSSFRTNTHTVFIGFIQEADEGGDLIKRSDEAFGAIVKVIGQQRIRSLKDKMKDISRPLKDYLGAVYEILILGPWAEEGALVEYEPKVGQRRAEGRIKIENQSILIEATVVTTGRDINFWGTIDLKDGANRICREILEKASQLKEAQDPVLLFISPHTAMLPQEIKMGISNAFQQNESYLFCGVIISDYRASNFKFVRNPNPSAKQLSETVWRSLIKQYNLHEVDLTDTWSQN